MLDEGLVHVVATDAHRADRRPPLLAVSLRLGEEEALRQVEYRPRCIIEYQAPSSLPGPETAVPVSNPSKLAWPWRTSRA